MLFDHQKGCDLQVENHWIRVNSHFNLQYNFKEINMQKKWRVSVEEENLIEKHKFKNLSRHFNS